MDVPADEPAGETPSDRDTLPISASAANGWLGGPPTDNGDDVKLDIDMGVAAQEENGDMDMDFIGSLDPTADDVASEMILMAMGSSGRSSP